MSKELVVNVTTSPKAELPVELMRTSNYFDYDQFNNNERASKVTVTFYAGEHGDIKKPSQLIFRDQVTYNVKIGSKLSDIVTPEIRPNSDYLVSSKPWGDEFNENTIVNGPMSFTAQYEKKAYPKDAYFYLLKPGHKNTENGNEAFLYVGKGRVKDDFLANAGDTDSDHMSYVSEYPSETEINAAIQKEYPNAETNLTWYRIVKSNGAPDQDGNPIVPSKNLTYHIDGYITIKAEDKFTAAFEVAKPSNVDIETQDNISKNTEITMPLKDKNITEKGINYTFDGWYLNKDYTQPVENNKYVMTQNQTFYARYLKDNNENSYKVSYLEKETNKKLIKDKTVEKITLPNGDFDKVVNGGTYTEKAQSISGYKVIGLAEKSITVGADSNNNLVFYYEKDDQITKNLELTINYYKDNTLAETDTNKYSTWIGNDTAKVNPAIVLDNEKYDGYKLDKEATKEAPTSIKNGDKYNIYYVKDTTKWTTVTFNKGTRGSLAGQDADGNVIFKDILKETTLAENNIKAPEITTNTNCEVADTPWNNGYAENKVINGETIFTAQYKKNINFTVYINDDFLPGNDRWAHLNKDTIGHDDKLAYTQAQIKDFANEYIGKKGYAKDTYKLVFKTKIEYLDNNKNKSWKDYDPETDKVLNEGFEVRYHVYIVKKLDVKFDLNNKENDVNYEVYNGSKLSDKQTVPTPSKYGYTFTGWKMNNNETLYDNDTIKGMKFNDNTTFKAQYVKDKSITKDAKLTVNYF
ncbi:MAG: InlB B-repeat-containing protein, partial [Erysipelotrichaceae bacterium]